MGYVTPKMIEQAKEIDLLTYLKHFEPSELVHFSKDTYTTRTHDSLKINNGMWYWWSRGIGGKSALDYLITVREMEFTQAVEVLAGEKHISIPTFTPVKKELKRTLLLPNRNSNEDRVIAYLVNRGIDIDILFYCIDKGFLFESLPRHNAVFVGMNQDNVPKYAAYRGTGTERFIGDASGSDKYFSFRLVSGTSTKVHLFESAIDLLSFATLLKRQGKDWKKENLLSLAGVYQPQKDITKSKVPKALELFLEEDHSIDRVVFHLDNDTAGQLATKAIAIALPNKYAKINEPPPTGKDFNDYLCHQLGLETTKKKERKHENER